MEGKVEASNQEKYLKYNLITIQQQQQQAEARDGENRNFSIDFRIIIITYTTFHTILLLQTFSMKFPSSHFNHIPPFIHPLSRN